MASDKHQHKLSAQIGRKLRLANGKIMGFLFFLVALAGWAYLYSRLRSRDRLNEERYERTNEIVAELTRRVFALEKSQAAAAPPGPASNPSNYAPALVFDSPSIVPFLPLGATPAPMPVFTAPEVLPRARACLNQPGAINSANPWAARNGKQWSAGAGSISLACWCW